MSGVPVISFRSTLAEIFSPSREAHLSSQKSQCVQSARVCFLHLYASPIRSELKQTDNDDWAPVLPIKVGTVPIGVLGGIFMCKFVGGFFLRSTPEVTRESSGEGVPGLNSQGSGPPTQTSNQTRTSQYIKQTDKSEMILSKKSLGYRQNIKQLRKMKLRYVPGKSHSKGKVSQPTCHWTPLQGMIWEEAVLQVPQLFLVPYR